MEEDYPWRSESCYTRDRRHSLYKCVVLNFLKAKFSVLKKHPYVLLVNVCKVFERIRNGYYHWIKLSASQVDEQRIKI